MAEYLSDLEIMASNVEATTTFSDICWRDVERWRALFNYSDVQARREIENWRAKFDRLNVSDDLWELIRAQKESKGYDREAYCYSIWLTTLEKKNTTSTKTNTISSNRSYILKLEGPLDSAEKIQKVAQLAHPPTLSVGTGECGDAEFATIDSHTRQKILNWVAVWHSTFRPTIVRMSQSPKTLDSNSMAPALGFDVTLPHHRPINDYFRPEPAQDQYPVWYFFYGNLAKGDELQRRLSLPELPSYVPATIRTGRIRSWRGKYKALVDIDTDDFHEESGSAYLVTSKEHEDILRFYETEKYEVVRCDIKMEDRVQRGLVFRFAGAEDELV